jgi:NCS1 family nucleobase:cation symporter-1
VGDRFDPGGHMTTALDPNTSTEQLPESDEVFHIETHGVDYISLSERWAKPRDVGWMWAGASVQVEYFIYGAILMTFGFTFWQALSVIIIGNLSYFLLGLSSLQGPQAGTTVFGTNRAAYGPNGSRLISFFNWITQLGFEVEGIILIVGASLVLSVKAGFTPGDPAKIVFVIIAVAIQAVLPFLGHATIVKVLRWLTIPFIVIFAIMLGFVVPHATTHATHPGVGWPLYLAGMAFTITLSGLGWTECGSDYSRYLRPEAKKSSIIAWVFVSTAIPEILVMTLGAAVFTFVKGLGTGAAFTALAHQSAIPAWFVVLFLIFAIFQIFAINGLDLYSSGVTLQAMGVRVKRYVAVLIDCVIVLGFTIFAVLSTKFSTYLGDFVFVVIIWIAPWFGIYMTDWVLRRFKYVPAHLQRTGRDSLYYRSGGIFWPAMIAQLVGMFAAASGLSVTPKIYFTMPTWLNEVTVHATYADFSVYLGIGVGALVYLVLAFASVRKQANEQDRLLAAEPPR